jgi:hypothetical protein
MKKILSFVCIILFIVNGQVIVADLTTSIGDFDPLVDISLTVEITEIRALDTIDIFSDPDFFVVVIIDNKEFMSPTWTNKKYINNPDWSAIHNIPDDKELVNITIQLWDKNPNNNRLCDISGSKNNEDTGLDVHLVYSIKTGHWYGDDYIVEDPSGYGRLNGCDDGSIYTKERDCEVFFDIKQTDYDGDGIPYWIEVTVYNTDPEINNSGEDADNDLIPIEWEHRWGFYPFIWDDHKTLDPEVDSLTNWEEYLTSRWGSDPYRHDLFLEIDYMNNSHQLTILEILNEVQEILKIPFHKHNIVFHLDPGDLMGESEIIPFDNFTTQEEMYKLYEDYFLHDGENYWRRSVFHYGLFVFECKPRGYGFSGEHVTFYGPGTNSFIISSNLMEEKRNQLFKSISYIYASAIMHEVGHTFGLRFGNPLGCDFYFSDRPWRLSFWIFGNYKSIMNYRYTYFKLDYSDGSHGRRDHNDWGALDFTYFEAK